MSESVRIYATQVAVIMNSYRDRNFYDETVASSRITINSVSAGLLFSMAGWNQSILYREFLGGYVVSYLTWSSSASGSFIISGSTLLEGFDEKTVTFNNCPDTERLSSSMTISPGEGTKRIDLEIAKYDADRTYRALLHGIQVYYYGMWIEEIDARRGNSFPWLELSLGDPVGIELQRLSPMYGRHPKVLPVTFSWTNYVSPLKYTLVPIIQKSAVVRWRYTEEETIHEIPVAAETSVTIPAGTFTEDSVTWQVEVTANSGVTTTSNWYTIRTLDYVSTASVIAPKNAILDGTKETVFQWQHVVSSGTAQTGADLQTSTDGSIWADLAHVDGDAQSYTAPADSFAAGTLYWRVRTYNTDGVAGAWSDAAEVIVVAASPQPIVAATNEPRPQISWQAEGQQAFQLRVGNYDSGSVFGTDKQFQYPDYLPDGAYTAAVRVQNKFGLWSVWGEAGFTVENVPGPAPVLDAYGTLDAMLRWSEAPGAAAYLVYRDGEQIAETAETTYTDRYAIGRAAYFVRAVYAGNGNYSDSNEAGVTLRTAWPVITATDGEWIHLRLNTTALPETQTVHQADISFLSLAGSVYPVPEQSGRRQTTYSFSAAFRADSGEISRFRGLLGREVFLKDQHGNTVYGVMSAINEVSSRFYTMFSASITRIEGTP